MWEFCNSVINACTWHKISFKNGDFKQMLRDLKGNGCLLWNQNLHSFHFRQQ